MIHSQIFFGSISTPTFAFDDSDIIKASCVLSVDLTGSQLAQDEMDVTVLWDKIGENAQVFAPADYDALMTSEGLYFATSYAGTDDLTTIPYGTPVWYYFNGTLLGKFFFKKATRTARDQYHVTLVSAVGLLGNLIDKGGIFKAASGDTFLSVLHGIIGGAIGAKTNNLYPITGGVFDCYVEEQAAAQLVEGWLPYATKRDNLHQLLFAESISLTKAADGTPLFSFLFDNPTPTELDQSKIYIKGDVNYQDAATAVEVTEHTFLDLGTSDELVTLFDGTAEGTVTDALVLFTEPIHGDLNGDLIATNLTVSEWGANYAIVSGSGTLQGYKYTHSRKTIRREVADPPGAENEYAITNVTLVSPLNSGNVADRLLAFYSASNTVDMEIVRDAEDPQIGRQYSFVDPFGDPKTGFVTSMDLTPSAIMKAKCHIVTDYKPNQGTNYKNAVLKTSGNIIVPAGVTKMRLILIGGGAGGSSGSSGSNGGAPTLTGYSQTYYKDYDLSTALGGAGGDGGSGGQAAKVLTVDLVGLTGGDVITVTYGAGGAAGASGTATTISVNGQTYTSADGLVPSYGVINLFTGEIYAQAGQTGVKGGNGGDNRMDGESVTLGDQTFTGGSWSNETSYDADYYRFYGVGASKTGKLCAAAGGGAAYGANGKDGRPSDNDDYNVNGGNGANGSVPPQAGYGCGGRGGSGGGGGGSAGISWYRLASSFNVGTGGSGGSGSAGGQGGDGCVLIYY